METITVEEYQRMTKTRSKYGNRKVKYDGYTFDSQAEYNRYLVLKQDEKNGHIRDLVVHPVFELVPAFTDRYGKRQRAIKHEVDFGYTRSGTLVVEDVKGAKTAEWKIKYKLFLSIYKQIDYQVVEV